MFLYVFHHVPPAFILQDKLVKLLANNNIQRDKKMETLRLLQLLCVLRATVAVARCPEKWQREKKRYRDTQRHLANILCQHFNES